MDGYSSVSQFPVIQESAKVSSAVEGRSPIQEPLKFQKTCLVKHHKQELPQLSAVVASPLEQHTQTSVRLAMAHPPGQSVTPKQDVGEDIARALHHVVCMPKVEYMRFDGDQSVHAYL